MSVRISQPHQNVDTPRRERGTANPSTTMRALGFGAELVEYVRRGVQHGVVPHSSHHVPFDLISDKGRLRLVARDILVLDV